MEHIISQEAAWKILNGMLGNLISRGIHVPTSVNKNLRHARFLLMVIKACPKAKTHEMEEIQREFDSTLDIVKNTLLALAHDNLGPTYHDNWRKRLNKAFMGESRMPTKVKKVPIALGIPRRRDMHHVRITLNGVVPINWIQDIAKHCGVTIDFEEDNVLRIMGRKEDVRKALDKVAQIYRACKV